MARRRVTEEPQFDLGLLAGDFPPTLNTADAPTDLEPNESPDCYGIDIDKDGRIKRSTTMPTGTSRVQKTITLSTIPYYWHYGRLWNITNLTAATASNVLRYGALIYNDIYVQQRNGRIYFDEDAQTIVAIVPVEPDSMVILKSTGGYALTNISDTRAFFQRTDIIQELQCAAAARTIEIDNTVFVSNALGLQGYRDGGTVDFTRPVRDALTNYQNLNLTADYVNKQVIATNASDSTTGFVYDITSKKILRWTGGTFRYTTRQFRLPDWKPFTVDRLLFTIEHNTVANENIKYQVKFEDEPWSKVYTIKVPAVEERFTIITEDLERVPSTHRFQLRITELGANKYIKEIRIDSEAFNADDYVT